MFNKINLKSEFFKYIVVLMSGTAMAQLFAYIFAPVITRLYTPAEVAELGLFLRIVGVGAAMASGWKFINKNRNDASDAFYSFD